MLYSLGRLKRSGKDRCAQERSRHTLCVERVCVLSWDRAAISKQLRHTAEERLSNTMLLRHQRRRRAAAHAIGEEVQPAACTRRVLHTSANAPVAKATDPTDGSPFTAASPDASPWQSSERDEAEANRRCCVGSGAKGLPFRPRRSLHTEVTRQWLACRLGLQRTPAIGRGVTALSAGLAYPSYMFGSADIFLRHGASTPSAAGEAASAGTHSHSTPVSKSLAGRRGGVATAATALRTQEALAGSVLTEGIYVGRSSIHGRGLFTTHPIPRGTRVFTAACRAFVTASTFTRYFVDVHNRLPDIQHYTHPSGLLMELLIAPSPHHLLNHSCSANLCAGLSRALWPAARASGCLQLNMRMTQWEGFHDANSLFATRDIEAGEELFLNYSARTMTPSTAWRASANVWGGDAMCRCGQSDCRRYLYAPPPAAVNTRKTSQQTALDVAAALLKAGYDDEMTILAHLPSVQPLVNYLLPSADHAILLDSSPVISASDDLTDATYDYPPMVRRRWGKGVLLMSYRQILRTLNSIAPQ